jgi:hypothetical protein
MMDEREIARRASALPGRFANRVPPHTLESLNLMGEGGEYGELTIELAASLAASQAPVTREERDEIATLLAAMSMPQDPVNKLNTQV